MQPVISKAEDNLMLGFLMAWPVATIAVLMSNGKGYGMEHNRGILRNAKKLVGAQD